MCNGPLLWKILLFSVPLMLSGILQLLFNAADIVVVRQFAGTEAMAAVGSTGSLNNQLVNVFIGLSIGTSIMVARYYGAQDWKNMREIVHTSMLVSFICGVALIFIGTFLAAPLLELMGTPPECLDQAVLYMRIIFVGMPAQMVYNFGAAILRAVGDTRRPLLFLLAAGIVNVLLNLFFVIVFHMDTAGGGAGYDYFPEHIRRHGRRLPDAKPHALPPALQKTQGEKGAAASDYQSRAARRHSGRGLLGFQCADPVLHQLIWFSGRRRKYGCQQY